MNTRLIGLGALAVAAGALQTAYAAPVTARYLERLDAAAEARLSEAGVTLNGSTVAIQGHLGGAAGVWSTGRVARSSGSRDLDAAAQKALRGLRVGAPPSELVGRTVTLTLGDAPVDVAQGK